MRITYVKLISTFCVSILLFIGCQSGNNISRNKKIATNVNCFSAQESGEYTTFYQPALGKVGDPMPFYENGIYYMFYLYENANRHPIYYTKTADFASYDGFYEAIPHGELGSYDEWIGTGSFIKKDGINYGFYCAQKGEVVEQTVHVATSTDMMNWSKNKSFIITAPEGFEKREFRDPHVYFDDTRNKYVMLVASRINNKGAIARFESENLIDWTQIPAITSLEADDVFMFECPDIFKIGDKWYLTYSRLNRDMHRKTFYRIADTPDGPWKIWRDDKGNKHDTFDGLYIYAAKTVSDGSSRYISGWCSTGQEFNNKGELDWSGTLVTHKIVPQPDGRLFPVIPQALNNKFTRSVSYQEIKREGNVSNIDGGFNVGGTTNKNNVVFNRNLGTRKITMKIDASHATGNFGIGFGACDEQQDVYRIEFDLAGTNTYSTPAVFMRHNARELNFTPLIVPADKLFEVTIIMEKSVCVMYINGCTAFTNRIYKMDQNPWMIYAGTEQISFTDIKIFEE